VAVARALAAREEAVGETESFLQRERGRLAAQEADLSRQREEVNVDRSKARRTMEELTKKAEALLRQEREAPSKASPTKPKQDQAGPMSLQERLQQANVVAAGGAGQPWLVCALVCTVSAVLACARLL